MLGTYHIFIFLLGDLDVLLATVYILQIDRNSVKIKCSSYRCEFFKDTETIKINKEYALLILFYNGGKQQNVEPILGCLFWYCPPPALNFVFCVNFIFLLSISSTLLKIKQ